MPSAAQLTVDHEPVAADRLGLSTVGGVLNHLDLHKRFVTQMLIDGKAPVLDGDFERVRTTPLAGKTVYVETTGIADVALDVIDDASQLLGESRLTLDDAIKADDAAAMLRLLGTCFGLWAEVDEANRRLCEVLRIDPARVTHEGRSLADVTQTLAGQLTTLRRSLGDVPTARRMVAHELPPTIDAWRGCLDAMRGVVGE